MWFLYLVLTAPPPDDLPRSTGAVEEPVEEADSEDDDSIAVGDGELSVVDSRERRQQQEEDGDDDDDVGGGAECVEGVEVIEGILCRDDIAAVVSELPAMRKRADRQLPSFLSSSSPPLPFDILQ